jgi:hypothetical protein
MGVFWGLGVFWVLGVPGPGCVLGPECVARRCSRTPPPTTFPLQGQGGTGGPPHLLPSRARARRGIPRRLPSGSKVRGAPTSFPFQGQGGGTTHLPPSLSKARGAPTNLLLHYGTKVRGGGPPPPTTFPFLAFPRSGEGPPPTYHRPFPRSGPHPHLQPSLSKVRVDLACPGVDLSWLGVDLGRQVTPPQGPPYGTPSHARATPSHTR